MQPDETFVCLRAVGKSHVPASEDRGRWGPEEPWNCQADCRSAVRQKITQPRGCQSSMERHRWASSETWGSDAHRHFSLKALWRRRCDRKRNKRRCWHSQPTAGDIQLTLREKSRNKQHWEQFKFREYNCVFYMSRSVVMWAKSSRMESQEDDSLSSLSL